MDFLKKCFEARNQQYLVSKKAEWLEQGINYTLKLLPKYMKHYEMQVYVFLKKVENPRHWVVSLYLCMYVMSLGARRVRFTICLGGLVVSDTHEADILGRK